MSYSAKELSITNGMNTKLQWKVKHTTDFSKEVDFLETLLEECGVAIEDIPNFLKPTKKFINDPFLMKNMDKAIELFYNVLNKKVKGKEKIKIFLKVDSDCDGFCSSSIIYQFIKALNPDVQIDYQLNFEKAHGLYYKNISNHTRDEYDLIIIPDASMELSEAKQISANFDTPILVLDHHLIEQHFFNVVNGEEITREEAKVLYKKDKNSIKVDYYTNYCIAVNCTDGKYPNPCLSGAGVVQKFIEAYCQTYHPDDDGMPFEERWLDLVSLAMVSDAMDVRQLEVRYYVLEGMKEYNKHNDFINELQSRCSEDMKFGRTITSTGWVLGPKINGCIRYGKPEEQDEMFRAIIEEVEDIEYQPKRKKASDPKPDIEIHTLAWDAARVACNVKSRQDNEVRKFVKEIEKEIYVKQLYKNSVLFVDGTKVLTKGTVSGLVANKLAQEYFRPVILLREKNALEYGGSGRGYDKGGLEDFKSLFEKAGGKAAGHSGAFGLQVKKDELNSIIQNCNKLLPIDSLCTIHQVDWELEASKLKKEYVQEVAENYMVFGNTVPEPLFAIKNLKINASKINGYGDNNIFIRFTYKGITFVKKYCSASDFDTMTLRNRHTLGVNKKNLRLNLICQFVLNNWEDRINPEVKILYFDSEQIDEDTLGDTLGDNTIPVTYEAKKKVEEKSKKPKYYEDFEDEFENDFEDESRKEDNIKKNKKKKVNKIVVDNDDDFDW